MVTRDLCHELLLTSCASRVLLWIHYQKLDSWELVRTALINAKKVLTEKRGGGSLAARRLCYVLQLAPLELGAVGTPVRVRGAAGALSSPETVRKGPVLHASFA